MSVMDKFINIMKLNDEEDDGYYDEDDYYEEDDVKAEKPAVSKSETSYEEEKPKKTPARVTPLRPQPRKTISSGSGMEVCAVKPTSIEEAREIADYLLANRTVILNLEGIDMDIAQRIIDFTSGACYAIQGNLQKISNFIFIITPASVDVSGDFQGLISGSFDVPSIH